MYGIMIVNVFYENVKCYDMEYCELVFGEKFENVVFEFKLNLLQDMLVVCLWLYWQKVGEFDLLFFVVIMDELLFEVVVVGYDCCIILIKLEYVDVWLNFDFLNFKVFYDIFDDWVLVYYEYWFVV